MTEIIRRRVGVVVYVLWGLVLTFVVVALSWRLSAIQSQANELRAEAALDRKRAENDLRQLQMMVNMLPAAFVVCDEAGTIKLITADSEDVLGWPAEMLVGNNITMTMDAETAAKHTAARDQVVFAIKQSGPDYVFKGVYVVQGFSQDGKRMYWRIHMNARLVESGVEFYSLVVRQRPHVGIERLDTDPNQPPLRAET